MVNIGALDFNLVSGAMQLSLKFLVDNSEEHWFLTSFAPETFKNLVEISGFFLSEKCP